MLFCPDYISEVENWMISPSRTLVIIKIADISRTTDLNLDQTEYLFRNWMEQFF